MVQRYHNAKGSEGTAIPSEPRTVNTKSPVPKWLLIMTAALGALLTLVNLIKGLIDLVNNF